VANILSGRKAVSEMNCYDFSAGKLDAKLLREILPTLPLDDRTIVGPRVGEDAAVIDMGDRYLVAATDPITFATDLIGWYAVQVNANDVATMGATPKWFLATILLPDGKTDEQLVRGIFAQNRRRLPPPFRRLHRRSHRNHAGAFPPHRRRNDVG
jgi:hydrogenase maturation factor